MPKQKEKDGFVLVKLNSHRARDKAFRLLNRKPQGYWSNRRDTGTGGTYAVTPEELKTIQNANIKGVSQTYWSEDLGKCIDWS